MHPNLALVYIPEIFYEQVLCLILALPSLGLLHCINSHFIYLLQRRQPPLEGEQILLGNDHKPWQDPRKESSKPLPVLESEKGVRMPTWTTMLSTTTLIGLMATFNHLRLKGKW